MKNIFNFKVALSTKSINNILRLATLAAACLTLPTHALAQSSCPGDLNGDGEVDSSDVGSLLLDFGPCPAPAPSITLVHPSSGPTVGTAKTIVGTNFTGATSVTVGGIAAHYVVVSANTITAISPANSVVGAVDIVVDTPNGTDTLVGGFTYFDSSWYTILEQAPNPTVVLDAAVRAKIVESGFPWRVRDNSSGIEMVLIPGRVTINKVIATSAPSIPSTVSGRGIEMLLISNGTFTMGCSASNSYGCSSNENPTHQVTLSKAFYLGKTEVTQAQWQAIMGNNPSAFSGNPNNPVETVSWNDIAGFNTATGLRLPTEAEWEFACRAGTTTHFHSMPGYPNGTNDESLLGNIAWYRDNSAGETHAVGGKAANAFGMYDMSGNVLEWCNDWYRDYMYIDFGKIQPTGPMTRSARVLRGGGWGTNSSFCRSSSRGNYAPGNRYDVFGFRVARTP